MPIDLGRIASDPSEVKIGSLESLPIGYDFAPNLEAGETISSVTVVLNDLTNGVAFATGLNGSASINGTLIVQTIGPGLIPQTDYESEVTIVTSLAKRWTMVTRHPCPV